MTPASPGPSTSAETAKAAKAATPATNNEPLPEGTVGETHATLVRLANAGNGAAAVRLADLMALCADYVPKTRETAEKELVEGMAVFDAPDTEDEVRQHDALVAMVLGAQDRQQAMCPGFAELGIADPLAEQRRWTELAARLGEARALVALAESMIGKYSSPGDIVEHAEEIRRIRPQAMAMLQQAAVTGEPMALLRMSAAHRSGDLAPRDPVEAYAWMLAYRDGPPAPQMPGAALELVTHRLEAPLDDAQRAQARRRADAIRARCCAGG